MPGLPRMPEAPTAPGRAAWRPAWSQREMSPSPRLSPALSASSTSTGGLQSASQGLYAQEDTPTNEELLAEGRARPTGPGRTTETIRQGLGLGDQEGGGGLETLHTYPNTATRQHHEHPLCQEACGERPRCMN